MRNVDKEVTMSRPMLLLALLWPLPALAAPPPQVEASMVVTGTITVNAQGGVQAWSIRGLDQLPPAARHILQATIPGWRFVPIVVAGKPVASKAGMALRIVADFTDLRARKAIVRVAGASFGCEARAKSQLPGECAPGTTVTKFHARPPRYPMDALRARVGGEVLLELEIDRNGRVARAAARQVNLYSRPFHPDHYREVLAQASVRAAREWQFRIPTTGPGATKDHWIVAIPISYAIGGPDSARRRMDYGQWNVYIPGPVQSIPWDEPRAGHVGSDAIAGNGTPFVRDARFVLETPLSGAAG